MTIQAAAAKLRSRSVSSVELTRECLARIEKLQPELNAFMTLIADHSLAVAAERDAELIRGEARGPLHGIPVAVKDVYCTKDVRTTCGSALFEDFVPDHDAAVVEKLAAAGAVLLGKTSMHELAYGITSNNPHFGTVRNPHALNRIPGGSSGGSGAAVASEMAFMAMGSDTGGSIRIPASFCGTVGLKPTTGRISRYGVLPLDFTLDHMGPLTRSVRDAALCLNALAGYDPRDESSSQQPVAGYLPAAEPRIKGLRIGLPENFYFNNLQPDVDTAVRKAAGAAEARGGEIIPIRLPDIEAINTVGRLILFAEAATVMEPYLDDRSKFGPDVLALFDHGRLMPATDYIQAQRIRRLQQQEFSKVWNSVDCLIMPTTPMTAPPIGAEAVILGSASEDVRLAATRLVRAFNVLGLPALSMPCGVDRSGLPIGLQIAGPAFGERRILDLGAAIEPDFPLPAPPSLD
jgi:aspartyl-tRNA(Asn)/glutamyl-tRNA(Gln) amidotransferase subunit A